MNRYYNPVRTLEGPGSLSSLPEILNGMEPDSKRILLLVWSEEVLKNPAFSFLLDQKSGFQTLPFSFQASNPTVEQLFETYEATKEFAPAVVIAVGEAASWMWENPFAACTDIPFPMWTPSGS